MVSIRIRMEGVMSYSLLLAASLTVTIGLVHSWLGEVRLIGPLLHPATRSGLLEKSRFARQVLRFAWHLTTIAWWGTAAVLALLAFGPLAGNSGAVLIALSVTFAVTGAVALVTSRGRHLAWPVFLAIAGLTLSPLL